MKSIKSILDFIINNWTYITVLFSFIYFIYKKVLAFMKLKNEQKVDAAITIIRDVLIKNVMSAEIQWEDFEKTGAIKRAQVISEVYETFPFLKDIYDQKALIDEMDKIIDEVLKQVRIIMAKKKKELAEKAASETIIMEDDGK